MFGLVGLTQVRPGALRGQEGADLLPSGRAPQGPSEGKVCGAAHSSVSLSRHAMVPHQLVQPNRAVLFLLMQQMYPVQVASTVGWVSPRSLLRQAFRRAEGDPGSWLFMPLWAGAPQPPSPSLSAKLGIISEHNLSR